jgi:hypothetical protein
MPDFGIFRGFNEKLFGDKLVAGQLPINLGLIGSDDFGFTGLLDLYPNAAAAYSLRKLRKEYTGSAIEVRRTNNDVADIGFTSTGELDTAALLAFTGTGALDNGFVTTWYDQSGNARNATQTLAINQPQIVSAGSVINVNSKPSIKFDGLNDFLRQNYSLQYTNVAVMSVAKMDSLSGIKVGLSFNDTVVNRQILMPRADGGTNYFATYNLPSGNRTMTVGTNQYLLQLYADTTNAQFYQNASALGATIPVISATNADFIFIGSAPNGNVPMQITHQELIVYESAQGSNRTGIQDNINDFYSIY